MMPCKSDAQRAANDPSVDDLLRFVVRRFESRGGAERKGRSRVGPFNLTTVYHL